MGRDVKQRAFPLFVLSEASHSRTYNTYYPKHSHKKRKDSLEGSLVRVLFVP